MEPGGAGPTAADTGASASIPGLVTEHRPEASAPAPHEARELGEDCAAAGAAGCASGLCLKVRPGLSRGYVCAKACDSGADCPSGWRCTSLPADPRGVCTPDEPRT